MILFVVLKIHFPIKSLGWTSDYEHIFTSDQISELDSIISKFEKETTNEIAMYFITTGILLLGLIVYVNLMDKLNEKKDIYPYIYGVIITVMTIYIVGLLVSIIYLLTRGTMNPIS